jgi:hypothetical protein
MDKRKLSGRKMKLMANDSASDDTEEDSTGKIVAKYFMHGASLIFLGVVLFVAWLFVTLMIVVRTPSVQMGALTIIGVVTAYIAILFIEVGWLNAQVSQHIWRIQVKQKWASLLGHGFLLFIFIAIAGIPFMIISPMMMRAALWTYIKFLIVNVLIYSLVIGYICKHVADVFTDDELTTRTGSTIVLDQTTFRGQ